MGNEEPFQGDETIGDILCYHKDHITIKCFVSGKEVHYL